MTALLALAALIGVIVVVVVMIRKATKKGEEEGSGTDLIAYLVLAISMSVAGFALAHLVSTAFPGDRFVFDPTQNLSAAVSALVVSLPFAVYFWRRQAQRRALYPGSVGWTLYLTLMELVFLTAFVVNAVLFINGLLSEERASAWTGTVVFGVIVLFHELAARRDPPQTEAGELRRVVGSAIGLITATIGLAGTLVAGFERLIGTGTFDFDPWLAMLIVGAPIWAYRWFSAWPGKPETPRTVWSVAVQVASVAVSIGSATYVVVLSLQYVLANTAPAGQHFDDVSIALGVGLTTLAVWLAHRRSYREVAPSPRVFATYVLTAVSLAVAIAAAVALTIFAFGNRPLVGGDTDAVVATATVLVVSLSTWGLFGRAARRAATTETVASWPRRMYTLGLGVIMGLVAAGALITTLVVVLNRLLDDTFTGSLVEPMAILLFTGLATWYLLGSYVRERAPSDERRRTEPFDVTIVTSHPGQIAVKFPENARLRVIHRGDDQGPIDDDTADQIVAAVDGRSSVVWVDSDGFRVAPMRPRT